MANGQTTLLLPQVNSATAPMILHASKNPIPEEPADLILANLVECDFPGYAALPLDDFDETENVNPDDIGEALTRNNVFEASDDLVTAQPICFVWITRHPDGVGPQLLHVQDLGEPFIMDRPHKMLELRVRAMATGLV